MADELSTRESFTRELRKAREYQKIELEAVAGETHISLDYLVALESGEWERIPWPFLRGYLTAYAESVGMVRDKVLKRFDELDYTPPPPGAREDRGEESPPPIRMPFAPPRRPAAETPEPQPQPARAATVPSFWEAVPARLKALAVGTALALLILAGWGLAVLVAGVLPGDGGEDESGALATLPGRTPVPAALSRAEAFQVRVETGAETRLSILGQSGRVFAGLCPADSAISFTSATEVIIETEKLEHLRVRRNGQVLDLAGPPGRAELRLGATELRIVRRSP